MKSPVLTVGLVMLAAVALFATAATVTKETPNAAVRKSQNDERAQRKRELRERYPVTDYDSPAAENASLRARRGKDFEKQGFALKDSSPKGVEEVLEDDWALHTPALPVSRSDVIVIGEVLQAQAHLSQDKTGIYSEFNVRIDSVLKTLKNSLSVGDVIPLTRVGGRVRYANGHSRLYRISGQNMPRPNARYLFFLKGSEGSDSYHILTGYEVDGQKVMALDDSTTMKAFDQMGEAAFLETVRKQLMP